jgi:hypothetical protein
VSSVVLGGVTIAVGAFLAVWELGRLNARWGEPRVSVIASRRKGHWFRWCLLIIALGLLFLAGGVRPGSAWWWSALAVWVAILVWDLVVWLRAPSER